MIYGHVNGQSLYVHNDVLAGETIDKIAAKFEFGPEWEGLTKVVFFENKKKPYPFLLVDDAIASDRHLNLWAGHWNIYVWGFEFGGEYVDIDSLLQSSYPRLTTVVAQLYVERTGEAGTNVIDEEMMGFGEQVLAAAAQAVAVAQDVQRRADEGEFDAEPLTVVSKTAHYEGKMVNGARVEARPTWYTYHLSDGSDLEIQSGKHGDNGLDGLTPYVGPNGNWWIPQRGLPDTMGIDTGKPSQGDNGRSVYITEISESTESGGISTLTFNDDTELHIKNGIDGKDYVLTDEDKEEIAGMVPQEAFVATYGVTTWGEVKAAVDAGKAVVCHSESLWMPLVRESLGGSYDFIAADQPLELYHIATLNSAGWSFLQKTMPSSVASSTVANWGFYKKPVDGIPESDLSAEVQTKLNSGGGGVTDEHIREVAETESIKASIDEIAYREQTDNAVAYAKAVPERSKTALVGSIGGHSENVSGVIVSAVVDKVVCGGAENYIPEAIRNLNGYGWSAGSVYNEVDFKGKRYIQRVGSVDMSTLAWNGGSGSFFTNFSAYAPSDSKNILCAKYSYADSGDKTIRKPNANIGLNDSAYATASALTSGLNGVLLYYELKEPIITDISSLIGEWEPFKAEHGDSVVFHQTVSAFPVPNSVTFSVFNPLKDVQMGGASIVADGVAEIPMASTTDFGAVKVGVAMGTQMGADGVLQLAISPDADITLRRYRKAITPLNVDFAVKAAMCDGVGAAWTEAEQLAAQQRLGIISSEGVGF